jgi:Tfp pilus assembly PilM family ATPase
MRFSFENQLSPSSLSLADCTRNSSRFALTKGARAGVSTGIDCDASGIRAAMLTCTRKGLVTVEALEEIKGAFENQEKLISGLKDLKSSLPSSPREKIIFNLQGKEVYATQIRFPKLPQPDMLPALKLELKKLLPFNAENAVLDYQILDTNKRRSAKGKVSIIIAAVEDNFLEGHLACLDASVINPTILEVMPLALANALWTSLSSPAGIDPAVALHLGSGACTLVIDGNQDPFFFRNLYFSRSDFLDIIYDLPEDNSHSELETLGEEISKSLNFYRSTYKVQDLSGIYLTGSHSNLELLPEILTGKTGLRVQQLDLCKKCGYDTPDGSGKFDIPIALALQGQAKI